MVYVLRVSILFQLWCLELFRQWCAFVHLITDYLGFDAWPTCQMVTEASDRTVDLMYTIRQDKQDPAATTSPLAGMY